MNCLFIFLLFLLFLPPFRIIQSVHVFKFISQTTKFLHHHRRQPPYHIPEHLTPDYCTWKCIFIIELIIRIQRISLGNKNDYAQHHSLEGLSQWTLILILILIPIHFHCNLKFLFHFSSFIFSKLMIDLRFVMIWRCIFCRAHTHFSFVNAFDENVQWIWNSKERNKKKKTPNQLISINEYVSGLQIVESFHCFLLNRWIVQISMSLFFFVLRSPTTN